MGVKNLKILKTILCVKICREKREHYKMKGKKSVIFILFFALKLRQNHNKQLLWVNFTNILWATFLYKSYMCSFFIQWNSVIMNSVVNEHSVMGTNFWCKLVNLLHKLTRLKRTAVITNNMSGPELFVITEFDCIWSLAMCFLGTRKLLKKVLLKYWWNWMKITKTLLS
jgi:hypothetical protein